MGTVRRTTSGQVAVYPACPSLYDRNVLGNFTTPAGVGGGWRFDAPSGTAISSVFLNGTMQAGNGWQAAIYTEGPNSHTLEGCPGATCPGASKGLNTTYDGQGASAVTTRVRCGLSGGCPNTGLNGQIIIYAASVTLVDGTAPSVAVVGGSVFGGWVRGTRDVTVNAVDNTGVADTTIAVDGVTQGQIARTCDYSQRVPCPSGVTGYPLPTTLFADGPHQVTASATDASGNAGAVVGGNGVHRQFGSRPAAGAGSQRRRGLAGNRQLRFELAEPAAAVRSDRCGGLSLVPSARGRRRPGNGPRRPA